MKLDGKFGGLVFKNKNGQTVPEDQWMVFLAKDNALPATLKFYEEECKRQGSDLQQLAAVRDLRERVDAWRASNPALCKAADVAPGELAVDVLSAPPIARVAQILTMKDGVMMPVLKEMAGYEEWRASPITAELMARIDAKLISYAKDSAALKPPSEAFELTPGSRQHLGWLQGLIQGLQAVLAALGR